MRLRPTWINGGFARLDDFEVSGTVERLSSTVNGRIKRLPVRYRSA